VWECKEEDICGGSLNTIWAGGALRDTEVEVRCGGVGGRQQQDHHGIGGAAHHIPQHKVEGCCGRGEEEFARGKHPGGVVLFKKTLRECSRKVKVKSESEMSADHLFVFE